MTQDEANQEWRPSRRFWTIMAYYLPLQTVVIFAVGALILDLPRWWIPLGVVIAALDLLVILYVRSKVPIEDEAPETFRL